MVAQIGTRGEKKKKREPDGKKKKLINDKNVRVWGQSHNDALVQDYETTVGKRVNVCV